MAAINKPAFLESRDAIGADGEQPPERDGEKLPRRLSPVCEAYGA